VAQVFRHFHRSKTHQVFLLQLAQRLLSPVVDLAAVLIPLGSPGREFLAVQVGQV